MNEYMPEGAEIRRAADKIESVLKNKTIEKVEFRLKPLNKVRETTGGHQSAFAGDPWQGFIDPLRFRHHDLLTHSALRCVADCEMRQTPQDQSSAAARLTLAAAIEALVVIAEAPSHTSDMIDREQIDSEGQR